MTKRTLEQLIPEYGEKNTTCNALKKEVASLNAEIKDTVLKMKQENKDINIDGWICTLKVSDEPELNEDKVLEVLKKHGITEVIKTKEYLDSEALESLIYAGKISKKILVEMNSKCKEVKHKETLYIKKAKEAKK